MSDNREEVLKALNKLKGIFTGETAWNFVHNYPIYAFDSYDKALDEIELYISQYEEGLIE